MMTRKDYVDVAKVLQSFNGEIDEIIFQDLVLELSNLFFADNSNFNYEKFKIACEAN